MAAAMMQKVVSFLLEIGLEVHMLPGASGFLPGIRINQGALEYDPHVVSIADILHEAGHLAITPAEFRPLMSDGLSAGYKAMFNAIDEQEMEPDSPMLKAILQCDDPGATAWAFAAGTHLAIEPEMIIDSRHYDGTGDEIRLALLHNAYLGINGLHRAGMCESSRAMAAYRGVSVYPVLTRWVQPADLATTNQQGEG